MTEPKSMEEYLELSDGEKMQLMGTDAGLSPLRKGIAEAINRVSAENGSDTPDWILAEYLVDCLAAFDKAVHARSKWYNHHCSIMGCDHCHVVEPAENEKSRQGLS